MRTAKDAAAAEADAFVGPADHVELTVQRMADLHAQHVDAQSSMQRAVTAMTARLARPRVLVGAVTGVVLWIGANLCAPLLGWQPLDQPPFGWLELIATVCALITTLMILSTQAREEVASRHRSQLTLQLASLTEQKIAKVIALLEEQRQDSEQLPSRIDSEAEAMAQSTDPSHVLDRIKDTHDE